MPLLRDVETSLKHFIELLKVYDYRLKANCWPSENVLYLKRQLLVDFNVINAVKALQIAMMGELCALFQIEFCSDSSILFR